MIKRYSFILKVSIASMFLFAISINTCVTRAYGAEISDTYYIEIQDVIDDILLDKNAMNFESFVSELISGKETFSFGKVISQGMSLITGEIKANVNNLGRLISLVIISAIFTNLSMSFKNEQVSEAGYYVTYLLLFTMLISMFIAASRVASSALESVLQFMKALVPAYFISVGLSSGATTSLMFYEAALMIITFADYILIKVAVPMINIYLIISLVNNISKEDMLSKFAELLLTVTNWLLKSLLGAVVGFNAIQGLIVPVASKVKRSTLLRATEAIPVIGDAASGVGETIIGASILLKNAIGVTGLIAIILISALPMIKLLVIVLIYKSSAAILQPISDKRILECISASAKAAGMLLQTLFIGVVLFMLTITIVAVTTGS